MSNIEDGKRWLNHSERDLSSAMVLMDKEFNEIACFHVQQVSEKALKSLFFLKGHRTVVTRSIQKVPEPDNFVRDDARK